MAIPWIIFERDIHSFKSEFPEFRICSLRKHTPFRYLVSGGLSVKQLLPSWSYKSVSFIEWLLSPLSMYLGLFETIELEKIV
jgi:hypothetical protein